MSAKAPGLSRQGCLHAALLLGGTATVQRALWGAQEAVCGPHGDDPGQDRTPLYREYFFEFEDHPLVWFRFVFLALSIGFTF